MVVNARSLKRVKRRVTADVHDIQTFPPPNASLGTPCFKTNIRSFLTRHALLPPPSSLFPHLVTWQVLLRATPADASSLSPQTSPLNNINDLNINNNDNINGNNIISLDVVEEDVALSRSVYCDQCRVVGWSGHPVCAKRYHFIVRADGNSIGGYVKPCPKCSSEVHLADRRCKTCNHEMTSEDVEDWVYQQLEDNTHLLHGVVHANGYGHLLRVNGREGGSRILSGSHIMDFWDRLCKYLGVRKISVQDVSKKYGLEYRLLHAITKGHPWYGEWGYEFGAGSFALTHDSYREAVQFLSSLPLSMFMCQGRKPRSHMQDLILLYQSLSERELVNIGELFSFLIDLVHDVQKQPLISSPMHKKRRFCEPGVLCAWSVDDIKRVEDSMFRVLRAVSGSRWVSWRTLRGAVCKAGLPELLDYCLKDLSGKWAGNGMTVSARCNPDTGALEYRLESSCNSPQGSLICTMPLNSNCPSREQILQDMRFLYEALLHPFTMLSYGPEAKRDLAISAASKLLDCKQFLKDYKPESTVLPYSLSELYLFCHVELLDPLDNNAIRPPAELITLSPNATIADLKREASKTFQEVYIMFRGLQAEELVDYRGVDDSTQVTLIFKSFDNVVIRGRCPKNGLGRFRMERGLERWTVDCRCGARDDDGERMLACDVCGIWQHTRCSGIHDFEGVPANFLCSRCRSTGKVVSSNISNNCKDESAHGGGGKSLAMFFDVR